MVSAARTGLLVSGMPKKQTKKKKPLLKSYKPVVLMVWDGFGLSKKKKGNAVTAAKMSTWNRLWRSSLHATLSADGLAVGLPPNHVGNSEAGHMTIGAGRPVETDLVRINKEIKNHTFHDNPALLRALAHVTRNKSVLHMMGLLTNHASGHSFPEHLYALIDFVHELDMRDVVLHLFTDGRDTPPYHATKLVAELQKRLPKTIRIGTIVGRYYAMDRNRFWERTERAYDALIGCEGLHADSPIEAVENAYARGESDEYIQPTIICKDKTCMNCIRDNDALIFWNLRSDRARQLTKPFAMADFEHNETGSFKRKVKRKNVFMVTLTEFGQELNGVVAAYPTREINGTLVEALRSYKQIYIAESEKFAHVTYFFNGGYDRARFGERRVKLATKRVAKYDEKPEMRAHDIAKSIEKSLQKGAEFVCANLANGDMVGHTGNFEASVTACEALDDVLAIVHKAVVKVHGILVVTSDHGNVESVLTENGSPDTEHNANPVPFLVCGCPSHCAVIRSKGTLADIAPTILDIMQIEKPTQMTGRSLLKRGGGV